jgi:hypothetical protein
MLLAKAYNRAGAWVKGQGSRGCVPASKHELGPEFNPQDQKGKNLQRKPRFGYFTSKGIKTHIYYFRYALDFSKSKESHMK